MRVWGAEQSRCTATAVAPSRGSAQGRGADTTIAAAGGIISRSCSFGKNTCDTRTRTEAPATAASGFGHQRAGPESRAEKCNGLICRGVASPEVQLASSAMPLGSLEGGGGGQSPEMLPLSLRLAAPMGLSPFAKIHQSPCVGPPLLSLLRGRGVAPTHLKDPHGNHLQRGV